MTVGAVAETVLRVDAPATSGASAIPLGMPVELRVLGSTADGRWLVTVGGHTFAADSSVTLTQGPPVLVVASRSERALELKVISTAVRFNEEQYAAALLEHVASVDPAPMSREARAALIQTVASLPEPLAGHVVDALARIVDGTEALRADDPTNVLSAGVKRHVAALVPFEARLTRGGDDASMSADIRALIGQSMRSLSAAPPAQADTGSLDGSLSNFARSVVATQIEAASQWLQSGTVVVHLPIQLAGDQGVDAQLRVHERAASVSGVSGRPFRFDICLTLPHLGAIEACVAGHGRELLLQVYVANASTRPFIQAELGALTAGLQRAGFTRVSADCAVDAKRFAPSVTAPTMAGPGRVLDARA